MSFPIVTQELSVRLEQSEIDVMSSRMLAIQERNGNPMGVEIQNFGGGTAFYAREMPWGSFNTERLGMRKGYTRSTLVEKKH